MKKGISITIAFVLMLFLGLQVIEPAAAVKVVDHVTKYQPDSQYGNIKVTWTTYQYSKNYLKIKTVIYEKKQGSNQYTFLLKSWTSLKKVSNKKLQIKDWPTIDGGVQIQYVKTKLTAAKYYWRVYRAHMLR